MIRWIAKTGSDPCASGSIKKIHSLVLFTVEGRDYWKGLPVRYTGKHQKILSQ